MIYMNYIKRLYPTGFKAFDQVNVSAGPLYHRGISSGLTILLGEKDIDLVTLSLQIGCNIVSRNMSPEIYNITSNPLSKGRIKELSECSEIIYHEDIIESISIMDLYEKIYKVYKQKITDHLERDIRTIDTSVGLGHMEPTVIVLESLQLLYDVEPSILWANLNTLLVESSILLIAGNTLSEATFGGQVFPIDCIKTDNHVYTSKNMIKFDTCDTGLINMTLIRSRYTSVMEGPVLIDYDKDKKKYIDLGDDK